MSGNTAFCSLVTVNSGMRHGGGPPPPDNNHFSQDPITGKAYRRILGDSYNTIEIQDADGKTLFRAEDCENFYGDSRPTLAGGNCLCQSYDDDTPTVLLSPNGEVLMKKYWDNGLD